MPGRPVTCLAALVLSTAALAQDCRTRAIALIVP
jgi:hypothetical protein